MDALNATFGPAVDDFSQQLNTIGADWQKTRDILSQPIDTNLGDIVSDLGFLTEIANRFTERGLEVPADIQAGIDRLGEALDPKLTGALGRADESALAAQKALAALGETADKTGFKIADLGSRLQRNIAVAAARGDEGAELAGLRRVEQRQQAFLDRILARPQTQANVELAEKAAANLEATRNRIQSILDGQAADAEAARADARKARDRADDALINILVGEERQARDRALRAAGTEGLRDDLRANAALQTILQRQIEVVRARVKDQDRANQIIAGLVTEVIGLGNERKDILRRMAEAEREAAEARFERIETRTELLIDIAESNENQKRVVALLRRRLVELAKEARVLKLTGNKLLENLAERARIRKTIRDMLEEEEETQNLGAQLNFRILQQAQGFAANVMSNLIPAAAAAGTVAGPLSPPPARPRLVCRRRCSSRRRSRPASSGCRAGRATRRTRSCVTSSGSWRA